MAYTPTTWVEGVTTLGPTNMNKIETELAYLDARIPAASVSYGTTLPGSPVDGQEAVLVDSTSNPSWQWRFRYNAGSSSAYKWEFVGGPPIINQVQADAPSASTVYTLVGTGATPAITLPRNGDYMFEWGAYCYGDSATQRLAYMCPNGGPYSANDADAIAWYASTVVQGRAARMMRANAMTAVPYGLAVRTASATTTWSSMFFTVTPIRVS